MIRSILILLCLPLPYLSVGQNTISIRRTSNQEQSKPEPAKTFLPSGIYISEPNPMLVNVNYESGKYKPVTQMVRFYAIVSSTGTVSMFSSDKKPQKVIKKYENNPKNWVEEQGRYELRDRFLYMYTRHITGTDLKYSGELSKNNVIHFHYKILPTHKENFEVNLYPYDPDI